MFEHWRLPCDNGINADRYSHHCETGYPWHWAWSGIKSAIVVYLWLAFVLMPRLTIGEEPLSEKEAEDLLFENCDEAELRKEVDGQGHEVVVYASLIRWDATTTRALNSFSKLRVLRGPFETSDLEAIASWRPGKSIESIHIRDTELDDKTVLAWGQMPKLQLLSLRNNEITGEIFGTLSKCSSLSYLDCAYNPIKPEFLHSIKKCTELSQLDLSGTSIEDEHCKHFRSLDQLAALILNDTSITDKALQQLGKCSHLEILYLQRTKVTDAGKEEFEKLNPKCVVFD